MIIFIYGPDTYRSRQKLHEIIARYKSIHKSGLSFVFDCEGTNFDEFKAAAQTISMFAEKKLVVVKDALMSEEFAAAFMRWEGKNEFSFSKDTICVFHDREAGRKNELFNWLCANAQTQEFQYLNGTKLINWLRNYLQDKKLVADSAVLWNLAAQSRGDLWWLTNRIGQLAAYKQKERITSADASVFEDNVRSGNDFDLVDALIYLEKSRALKLLNGESVSENSLFGVFALLCARVRGLAQAKRINRERIKKIYKNLAGLDLGIKTGKINAKEAIEEFIFAAQ